MEAVLERHRAFWERSTTDRPLLHSRPYKEYEPYAPYVRRDGQPLVDGTELTPGLLDHVATSTPYRPRMPLDGDFVCGWGPYDSCWTEAILGCRVIRAGPSVWSEPFVESWDEVDGLFWDGSNPWLEELLDIGRALAAEAQGEFPVCQPLLRGPLDMVEAAVPTDLLYPGFYDNPAAVRKLLNHCTDVFLETARSWLAATPQFRGGHMIRYEWGLWAPGSTVQFQADAMRNLSPRMYRNFMFEIDRRISAQFDYPIIHTHSGSAHILPVLAEVPELRAIEVALDPAPYGPPPLALMPHFVAIQRAGKSLLINGPMSSRELDSLLETLSPAGLCIRAALL
jgi:hypothetical protein